MKGKLHKLRNDLVNNIQKMPKGPQLRLQNWKQLYTIDKLPYQHLKKSIKEGWDWSNKNSENPNVDEKDKRETKGEQEKRGNHSA